MKNNSSFVNTVILLMLLALNLVWIPIGMGCSASSTTPDLVVDRPEGLVLKDIGNYSETFYNEATGENILVVSQLPLKDSGGRFIDPRWYKNGDIFYSGENTFSSSVSGLGIVVENEYETKGALSYSPELYLSDVLISPTGPILLEDDPFGNPNYSYNTLEWDYGICKRYLRIIEGSLLGSWKFESVPSGDIRINYNQQGDFYLDFGHFKVDMDSEFISVKDFESLFEYDDVVYIDDTSTFYPNATPETTSVDGYARRGVDNSTWASLRTSAGNYGIDTDTYDPVGWVEFDVTASEYNMLTRAYFLFDTSALPDTAVISDAVLSLYGYDAELDPGYGGTLAIAVVAGTPASNTAVVASDYLYTQFGTTLLSNEINFSDFNDSGYNAFTLNTTGIDLISKTGVTHFGVRESNYDATGSAPPWAGGSNIYHRIRSYFSEQGAGFQPKLVVTYTTDIVPSVTTDAETNVEETSCTGNGTITNGGSGTPSERGVCYSLFDPPTYSGSRATEAWNGSLGAFDVNITGLTSGHLYYARAYAVTTSGTGYGASESIYTKPDPVTDLSELFAGPDGFNVQWTTPGSVTGYYVRAKAGSYPTDYTDGSAMTVSGNSAGISGLNPETNYYVRIWSYFTNSPNAGGVSDSYDQIIVTTDEDRDAARVYGSLSMDLGSANIEAIDIARYGSTDYYIVSGKYTVGAIDHGVLMSFYVPSSGTPVFVDSGTFTTEAVTNETSIVHVPGTEVFGVLAPIGANEYPTVYACRVYADGTMDPTCRIGSKTTLVSFKAVGVDIQVASDTGTGWWTLASYSRLTGGGASRSCIYPVKIDGAGTITIVAEHEYAIASTAYFYTRLVELSRGSGLVDSIWVQTYAATVPYIRTFSFDVTAGIVVSDIDSMQLSDLTPIAWSSEAGVCVDDVDNDVWAFSFSSGGVLYIDTVEINDLTGDVVADVREAPFISTGISVYSTGLCSLTADSQYGVFAYLNAASSYGFLNYISDSGNFNSASQIGPTTICTSALQEMCKVVITTNTYLVAGCGTNVLNLVNVMLLSTTPPEMQIYNPTDLTTAGCTGRGYMADTGGETVTERGFCWNTTGAPTISDNVVSEAGSFSVGAYSLSITGFTPYSVIYMRSFATNVIGVGYSSVISFSAGYTPPSWTTYEIETSFDASTISWTSSGTIADQSVNGNDIHYDFGPMDSDLVVEVGILLQTGKYFSPSSTEYDLPDVFDPVSQMEEMYQEGQGENLPVFPLVEDAAEGMGWTTGVLYSFLMVTSAMALSVGVTIATGSTLLGIAACAVMMFAAVGTGVLALWLVIVYLIFALGFLVVARGM